MLPLGDIPAAGEWECMECGHVEEGMPARQPRKCPDCGAPAQAFEFFPFEDDSWDVAARDEEPAEGSDEDVFQAPSDSGTAPGVLDQEDEATSVAG